MQANLIKRTTDKHGSGFFGAPRKGHTHRGIDYACSADTQILSPCEGTVTKLGYAYGDDLSFRYVQITDKEDRDHRIFYIFPLVRMNEYVYIDDILGTSQDLTQRYPEITQHCHYEIKVDGKYINPEDSNNG